LEGVSPPLSAQGAHVGVQAVEELSEEDLEDAQAPVEGDVVLPVAPPVLPRTLGRQGLRAGAPAAMTELQALHQAKQAALARGADGLVGADAAPVGGGGPVGGAAQPDPRPRRGHVAWQRR
jgi:hypothetical protein